MVGLDDTDLIRYVDRRGRLVVLLAETWHEKIVLDHAEMIGAEAAVALAIETPDVHASDRVHPDREVYYRWAALPPPEEDRYVKVVVAYSYDNTGQAIGRVVTAFAVDFLARGETRLWTRRGFNQHSPR
jgi:hypothetical protein